MAIFGKLPAPVQQDESLPKPLPARLAKSRRKSPSGIATNELIFSAYQGTNADVFPYVLSVYVGSDSR